MSAPKGGRLPLALTEFRSGVRSHLPARAQDIARMVRDAASPSRRRERAHRSQLADVPDQLATSVSSTGRVLAGPFEGLWLPTSGTWGGVAARLAGAYEEELHAVLDELIAAAPPVIIDAGCAEGYYAVGLARRLPGGRVFAYDIDPMARRTCKHVAKANGTTNVTVKGRISSQELLRRVTHGSWIICDVEGFEDELLTPAVADATSTSSLIVELHEFAVAGVTQRLLQRFTRTHTAELINAVDRLAAGREQLGHLPPDVAQRAVDEGRPSEPPMQWLVLRPRVGGP